MYDIVLQIFDRFVDYAVMLIELIGVCVILYAVGHAVIGLFHKSGWSWPRVLPWRWNLRWEPSFYGP